MLLIAKVSDDFLISGMKIDIEKFLANLRKRFGVGKAIFGPKTKDDIRVSMSTYWSRVNSIPLSRARRRQRASPANASDFKVQKFGRHTTIFRKWNATTSIFGSVRHAAKASRINYRAHCRCKSNGR